MTTVFHYCVLMLILFIRTQNLFIRTQKCAEYATVHRSGVALLFYDKACNHQNVISTKAEISRQVSEL